MRSGLGRLAHGEHVTLEELLEVRELLEVPAARLAARRRAEEDVERLRATIPRRPLQLPVETQFAYNRGFHSAIVEACGNTMLAMAVQPIFEVLQTHLSRSTLGRGFHRTINEHHRALADTIASGDEAAAGEQMSEHLKFLGPYYERGWSAVARQRAGRTEARASAR